MTNAKWTQGPWVLSEDRGHMGSWLLYSEEEYGIGQAWDINDNPENKANAHLIAAAPDLYEALKKMVDACPFGDEPKGALTALAKARGEQ